jgi:SlyX protein
MANTLEIKQTSTDEEQLVNRITSLETRHAFQDDVIEKLNVELATHQAEIAELKQQLKVIAGRLKDLRPSDGLGEAADTPPPHY